MSVRKPALARLWISLALVAMLATLFAGSVAAAPQSTSAEAPASLYQLTPGEVCGEVTAFLAPTDTTAGSITIDGVVHDLPAGTVIDAAVASLLAAVGEVDGFVCLTVTVDGAGIQTIVVAEVRVCGTVTVDAVADVATVAGIEIPFAAVAGDGLAVLELAADAAVHACVSAEVDAGGAVTAAVAVGVEVCGDVTVNGEGTFAVAGVDLPTAALDAELLGMLEAIAFAGGFACVVVEADEAGNAAALIVELELCGTVALDADAEVATVGGIDIPFAALTAEGLAALQLAANAEAEACVSALTDEGVLAEALVSIDVELCGEVTFNAETGFMVDGIAVPAELIDADLEAALELALETGAFTCARVVVDEDEVTADVNLTLCITIDAITDTSITIAGVTLPIVAGADIDADVEAGVELRLEITVSAEGVESIAVAELAGCGAPAPNPTPTPTPTPAGGGAVPTPTMTLPASSTSGGSGNGGTPGSLFVVLLAIALVSVVLVDGRLGRALARRIH